MAARSTVVAVEKRFLLQCVAGVLAGSQIKVSRLTHCHNIFSREILTPAFVKKHLFYYKVIAEHI